MSVVLTSGAFDDIRSRDIRFLQEAAKLGALTVQLWQDDAPGMAKSLKFRFAERAYVRTPAQGLPTRSSTDLRGL